MKIIISTIIVSFVLAFTLGVLLGIFQKIFAVKVDERVVKIRAILPGINCGGCGFPGCDGFAQACVKGELGGRACAPGGAKVKQAIAEIMGASSQGA
ncbi:RnfABCDGE type electron transport complex subunit B [Treponema parvum]|uniref:RnfABCDGE type electron transport complex subunit B n=1 Tax=Treponema parvum TaxID=138851 RepID=A0A975F119_9SPIR|nr:RnfABCDGE type electron transport complex subunit B [Treponema parvum]QTQ12310.1 RnfABCDGE type electron transport complex subunit B [Treponema parvum]QTQ13477.1 RnfABCDGE type electron transport complex subunit B [Treponema parvum]QTQ15705.1 RnfABCDGE type electron transport complex subunit B [Treponema parvum]